MWPTHVGALKNAKAYHERCSRDIEWEFVSSPTDFPRQWPMIADPCNIVVQNGSARLTIDKSMWTSGRSHLPPANLLIDWQMMEDKAGKLTLVRFAHAARAAAIMLAPINIASKKLGGGRRVNMTISIRKFDLKAFFRFHCKQRVHQREQAKVMQGGFSIDERVNFGEKDAPDHCCRESDAVCFFIRREFARLDKAYLPSGA